MILQREYIMPGKDYHQTMIDALSDRVAEDIDRAMLNDVWVPESHEKKVAMERKARDWQKDIMNDWNKVRKQEEPLQQIMRELGEMKTAMRKIGILLDSDIPDEESFKKFKALREAYRRYKMVEKLILSQDK